MTLDSSFQLQLSAAAKRLSQWLAQFQNARILVVGDLTVDEFLTGQVERVSREAPVLILRHEFTRQVPGGGANAVYNVAALGAQVKAVGFVGHDSQGEALRQIFEAANIDTQGILVDGDRPTVTKTRISGHARQSVTQQIVRVDRKSDELPKPALQEELAAYIRSQLGSVDAVICSDYGDGTLTQPVIDAVLEHPLVVVDAQKDLGRYAGATVFTPNLPEAELAAGFAIAAEVSLQKAGDVLLELTRAKYMLITRGEQGMSIFDQAGTPQHVPAFNRTDVFDVTGAGDTVVAALTIALALGAPVWDAAVLGNLAASLVVRQFGTAITSVEELRQALQMLLDGE